MFTLAPATRWGYFVYPLGLLGWLALTQRQPDAKIVNAFAAADEEPLTVSSRA